VLAATTCSTPPQDDLNLNARIRPLPGTAVAEDQRAIPASQAILDDPARFVWGASVIRGEDSRYHMFYAVWDAGPSKPPFQDGWLLGSEIAYAVSEYPDRGFAFRKVLLTGRMNEGAPDAWDAQSVHNPHIRKFGDTYYLYYIGSRDPGPQPANSPGAALSKRNRVQQVQQIGVIVAGSIEDLVDGNWTRPDRPLLSPRTRVKDGDVVDPSPPGTVAKPDNLIVVNPSVVYRPREGDYLLFFKGNLYDPTWRGVHGVAIGDSPTGPFEIQDTFVFDVRMPDGRLASAEDPYVWYDPEWDRFYAILKDFSGLITGTEPGLALFTSNDGLDWEVAAHPLVSTRELVFEDGSVVPVHNLERPQLLLDEGGRPEVLYLACSVDAVLDKRDGSTFNVHLPLRH
jgi:hypothetical protein